MYLSLLSRINWMAGSPISLSLHVRVALILCCVWCSCKLVGYGASPALTEERSREAYLLDHGFSKLFAFPQFLHLQSKRLFVQQVLVI